MPRIYQAPTSYLKFHSAGKPLKASTFLRGVRQQVLSIPSPNRTKSCGFLCRFLHLHCHPIIQVPSLSLLQQSRLSTYTLRCLRDLPPIVAKGIFFFFLIFKSLLNLMLSNLVFINNSLHLKRLDSPHFTNVPKYK